MRPESTEATEVSAPPVPGAPLEGDGAGPAREGPRRGPFDRLVPRTALGVIGALFAAAVGAAFSGAVLFAYYTWRLNQTEDKVEDLTARFPAALDEAIKTLREERDDARAQIRAELQPLQELQASEQTLADLIEKTRDSVWFVATQDELGQPSVGSAFVVTADAEQSYLLTSLHVVRASTTRPSPPIRVRKQGEEHLATLWTWDETRDLALLVIAKPNLPRLGWAPEKPPLGVGQRVFAVAGIGGSGASITQGFVADVSAAGIQHDAAISGAFEGGPLVNSNGEVVGLATSSYRPLGFESEDVTYGPSIRSACERVLRCPEGEGGEAPGSRR